MRRSGPLRRKAGGLKRSALSSAWSPKRLSYKSELSGLRPLVVERSGGRCERTYSDPKDYRCPRRAKQVHHRWLRSQGGVNRMWNLIHLCNACHDWAHANPTAAKQVGLILAPEMGRALLAEESA